MPKPYRQKGSRKRIGTFDFETDPFRIGRVPSPFVCGLMLDDGTYREFWGDDCADQFAAWCSEQEDEFILYAHNGGNFDFHYLLHHLDIGTSPHIVNGRILRAFIARQEMRDSWAIIPLALSKVGGKLEIRYSKLDYRLRHKYRDEISDYLKADCETLLRLVTGFRDLFGDALTIGAVALPMLTSFHDWKKLTPADDEAFRRYYFGGRVQCFETGHIQTPLTYVDVNSMYPKVMRDMNHPVGSAWSNARTIGALTAFAKIEAVSEGALPWRDDDGNLRFDERRGTFFATRHEIDAGLETGTLRIERVHYTTDFVEWTTFADFVDKFYALRMEARANKDKDRDTFYKLVMNSAYGKFALNPTNFREYQISEGDAPEGDTISDDPFGWDLEGQHGTRHLWKRKIKPRPNAFNNVATAASITGAARATLLRGLAVCERPIYCDTDSIICGSFSGEVDPNTLGAWKVEATGDAVSVAGKKLYALWNNGECIKKASKGARLTGDKIRRVAEGDTIDTAQPAPKFKLKGGVQFIKRKIRRTGKASETS